MEEACGTSAPHPRTGSLGHRSHRAVQGKTVPSSCHRLRRATWSKLCRVQVFDSETEQPWAENVREPGRVPGRARQHSRSAVRDTGLPGCGLCLAGLWFMQTLVLILNTRVHTHVHMHTHAPLLTRKNHVQAPVPAAESTGALASRRWPEHLP